MGLPEPGPVSGALGVLGLLLMELDLEDALCLMMTGLMMGAAFFAGSSWFSIVSARFSTKWKYIFQSIALLRLEDDDP